MATGVDDPVADVLDLSEQRERLELLRLQAERLKVRRLKGFVFAAWSLVEPTQPLVWNWHLDVLCQVLEDVSAGRIRRVIINVPPGTMKSLLVSVFWPAWEWSRDPSLRYLSASYSEDISIRDSLRVRDIVLSEWYQRLFSLRISPDQSAKTRYNTTENGWRIATSVGGVGTGEHPDRIIIDDPISALDALSAAERKATNNWLDRTISTRGVVREVRVVAIMQRLHEEDPTAHLLAKGGWEHVCLPMEFELRRENDPAYRPDPRDRRKVPGELLWPELFTAAIVKQLRIDLGPYGAAGQLQQNPGPEGGGLFKRHWFKIVDAAPRRARRVRGWDTAGSEMSGDYTVGVRMAELDGEYFIEDVVRDQLGPAGVDLLMLETAQMDGPDVEVREEKEPGASGAAVIASHLKLLAGFDYAGVTVSSDKVTRAKPFRAQCEGGNVYLVRGEWNEQYLQELSNFPVGAHDDQVDGSSCAFNAILMVKPRAGRAVWGR